MPSNSRIPVSRTFLVALIFLAAFALIQIFASAWHYLPLLRDRLADSRADEPEAPASAMPTQNASDLAGSATPTPNPVHIARAAQFVAEADKNYRVGDFDTALRFLQQATGILPTSPDIQFRLGQVYEALNDKPQAFTAYERSLAVPGLSKEVRRQAEQKMVLLAQVMGESPGQSFVAPQGTSGPGGLEPSQNSTPMRDTIGLRPGSSLGIVDARIRDIRPGIKNLRIAIKSRPSVNIDPSKINVYVYFYEKEESGDVVIAEANSSSQWISPPMDWKDGEPEILNIEYPTPDGGQPGNSAERGALGRTYHGYVIGVYYGGDLQDSRSDPGPLESKFPLHLTLEKSPTQ